MALLKLKGATLMETLVATLLLVIFFMVASLVLNNLLKGQIQSNQQDIESRLNFLSYQLHHQQLTLPYQEQYHSWEISISQPSGKDAIHYFDIIARNHNNQKEIHLTAGQ